jgi:hypothetical protein
VLPELAIDATEWVVAAAISEASAGPEAQAVECYLPPPVEPAMASYAATAVALPALRLDAAEWVVAAAVWEAVAAPAAQPVESPLPQVPVPYAMPRPLPIPRLPLWTLAAVEPEIFREVAPGAVPPPSERRMPSPPAGEVVCEVAPWVAGALAWEPLVCMPAVAAFAPDQAMLRWVGGWEMAPAAEPVCSYVLPRMQETLPGVCAASTPCLPDLRSLYVRQSMPRGQRAAWADAAAEGYPDAVESQGAALPAAMAPSPEADAEWGQSIRYPGFALEPDAVRAAAEFQSAEPPAAAPQETSLSAVSPMRQPVSGLAAPEPVPQADGPRFGFRQPGPVPMEFFCQREVMAPAQSIEWLARRPAIHAPKFVVRPVFERIGVVAARPKPVSQTPAFAEIFAIREIARRRTGRSGLGAVGKAIAAALLVGIGIWFGAGSVKIGKELVAINTSLPRVEMPGVGGMSSKAVPEWRTAEGTIAQVRHAIEQRAAVELTDTFRRMEAWGAGAKALPAGWSRHPDGYVRIGQLALYHPSQSFADYRFEFFGEIEKKSMSWAVRARDAQNYYAMKFTVVEPGLRPVIAVVHYPVVGGRKGPRVQTPLSVMVHNHEPYHVEVEVRGNHMVTSIEGQEVDSWTDDRLKAGGVGFFSEAGESARLYWIRVTKNQDWLGRVCAYLSGGSDSNIAGLWRGEKPAAPPQLPPAAPPGAEVTMAAVETEEFSQVGPQRARIRNMKYGRTEPCRS